MEKIRKQIVQLIKHSENILLMPSAPVDGDSLGSSLALYLALKKLGKNVTVVCADPVPDAFQFLPTINVISHEFSPTPDFIVTLDCEKAKLKTIQTKLEQNKVNIIITAKKGEFSSQDVSFDHGPSKYDLIISVDTGDLQQLGRFYEDNPQLFTTIPLINIDHHASNEHFGKVNYVDVMASATTEILIPLMHDLEQEYDKKLMDEDIATLLLAGIITDTGSFQNANTTPRSFASAAQLIKHGARQQEIIHHVFKTKQLSTLRLWGRILSKIKVDIENKIVWSTITRKDFSDTGSREDETGGIIDELMSNAPGMEVILLLKDKGNNVVSGSLRTVTEVIDASQIAEMFGGGGHVQAAGFKIQSSDFATTESMVLEKIRTFQKNRLGQHLVAGADITLQSALMTSIASDKPQITKETKLPENPSVQRETEKKEKPHVDRETKVSVKEEKIEREIASDNNSETHFTDMIIKKASTQTEPIELEPEMVYKFEE